MRLVGSVGWEAFYCWLSGSFTGTTEMVMKNWFDIYCMYINISHTQIYLRATAHAADPSVGPFGSRAGVAYGERGGPGGFLRTEGRAGVEVGCRGEVRTHIHTYKPIFLSCAFPRCVCKEDHVVFFSVEVVCFGAASTVRRLACGGKGSQWWHGGGAATCMCRRGWVAGEGELYKRQQRWTSDS